MRKLDVLRNIDLEVKREELLIIQGPSGAGKSTLLHILGGLDEPTRGNVFLDGVDMHRLKDAKKAEIRNRKMGFVFQFYYLLPEFTIVENVMLPALINRRRKIKKRDLIDEARKLLGLVGLSERLSHKPHELSGGEMQRVAIARALINNPELIFCDEPTGNLDSQTGKEICDLLQDLNNRQKKTLVIVTHEEEITKIAKRVIHMRDGRFYN
jgi:lipoprotein-releasing system ATP-binding protein